jgi:hypothetical protein
MTGLGAMTRPVLTGEPQQVLPFDNATLLGAAKPRLHNGQVVPDHAAKAKRQEAFTQKLLKAGPVAVAILGGGMT